MTDRIEIKIIAGRDLTTREGDECNACVRLRFASETSLTKTLSRSSNPTWPDETIVFNRVAEKGIDHITAEVLHKNVVTGQFDCLGVVTLGLTGCMLSPGVPVDEWLAIQAPLPGRGDAAALRGPLGEIRVRLQYILEDGLDLDTLNEGVVSEAPNCLTIVVGKARNLRAVDHGTCDAYITASCGGDKVSTTVEKGSCHPSFGQTFTLPVVDGDATIDIKVKHKALVGRKLLGVARISMVDVASGGTSGIQRWFPLLTADNQFDGGCTGRGEVELTLSWNFDERYVPASGGYMKSIKKLLRRRWKSSNVTSSDVENEGVDESSDEGEDYGAIALSAHEQDCLSRQREERLAQAREQLERYEANVSKVKSGDYQVQVHVIEVQDLKAEGGGGTSNPYVTVKCMGQHQRTSVHAGTNSCIFNEKIFFNFRNVAPAQLREADLDLSVASRNLYGLSSPCIGKYSLNLLNVYGQRDHEYYQQWVALTDPTDRTDSGIQGYLKVSVTVLGPGDSQHFHDPEKEYQDFKDTEARGLAGDEITLLTPATIQQELQFLVVSVFEASDLPMMDRFTRGGLGGRGIDAFVQCKFAGNPALRTKVVHARGKAGLNAEFMEQLWIPVNSPTMSNRIALSLWDRDYLLSNKCVAHTYFNFKDLPKLPQPRAEGSFLNLFSSASYDGPPPTWVNLYGAATDLKGSKTGSFENTYPDVASTYRGRLLVAMHVYTQPRKCEVEYIHKKTLADLPPELYPKIIRYTFRVALLLGSELPTFTMAGMPGAPPLPLRVVVDFGPKRFIFSAKHVARGRAEWIETQEDRAIELAARVDMLPDVGVYLCRGSESSFTTISFARVPAAKFLTEAFKGDPFWLKLQPDQSRDRGALKESQYPGALLLRVGLGTEQDAAGSKWVNANATICDTAHYRVRVHVYQGRDLPSSDPNGLLDPYVKVKFCGTKQKTRVKRETTSPLFYETLEFDTILPKDLRFAPEVVLQVWDSDAPPPLGRNMQVGLVRFDLAKAKLSSKLTAGCPGTPCWMNIDDAHGNATSGALLVGVQLIPKKDASEPLESPSSIHPPMRQAYIEITALGVRNMHPFGRGGIQEPFVRFDLPGIDDGSTFSTKPSKSPRGRDANFLVQRIIPVRLPENPLYAPQVTIRVYDRRLGGIETPLIGATCVSLNTFIPWNTDEYQAPQSHIFDPFARSHDVETGDTMINFNNGVSSASDSRFKSDRLAPSDDHFGTGVFQGDIHKVSFPTVSDLELTDLGRMETGLLDGWLPDFSGEARRVAEQMDSIAAGPDELDPMKLGIKFPTGWSSSKFRRGRDWWIEDKKEGSKELEHYLETMPFEHYTVYRGKFHANPKKNSRRAVGTVKGVIRVTEDDPRLERKPLIDMHAIGKEDKFKVRVYVVRGKNLQPVGGGLSDPYLRIKLGNTLIVNDKSSMQPATADPDFYKRYEFEATIPGLSSLEIELRDFQHNPLATHELIGATTIDLEDRWFHRKWQELGHAGAPGYLADVEGPRSSLKPLELRNLYLPGSEVSQGQLEMWLEILPVAQARVNDVTEIFGPPTKKFELRLICWKAEGVPRKCGHDLYTTFKMTLPGGPVKLSSDIHFACKDGKPSWNYRIIIPLELPLKDPLQGRLTIQMWDFDVLTPNDIVAERHIDLYQWLLMAYHSDREVQPFTVMNRAKAALDSAGSGTLLDPAEGRDTEQGDNENDVEHGSLVPLLNRSRNYGSSGTNFGLSSPTANNNPLISGDDEGESDDENDPKVAAQDALDGMLGLIGLGPIAEDATWLKMSYYNQKKKKLRHRGKLALSISIVPEADATSRPAGKGRSEPNANPYLPPPVGRMTFSFNPCSMIMLLGSFVPWEVTCCICGCLTTLLIAAVLLYGGSYYVTFQTWLDHV